MTSLMFKLAPLLAFFGIGGGQKYFSRLGFVPENHIGIPERFRKVIRYRIKPCTVRLGRYRSQPCKLWFARWRKQPKYRIMTWRRFDNSKAGQCPYHILRWRRFNAEKAGQPKYRGSGYNWRGIPFLDKTHHVATSNVVKPLELPTRELSLADQTFFMISASIRYRIIDPDIVSFRLEHFEAQLKQSCEAILMLVICKRSSTRMQKVKQVNAKLLKQASKLQMEFGIEFVSFALQQNKPTQHSEQVIQRERFITVTADALVKNANKLKDLDAAAVMALTGSGILTSGGNIGPSGKVEVSEKNLSLVVNHPSEA